MYLEFLTDENMSVVKACADNSCTLFKADPDDVPGLKLYENIIEVFTAGL